MSIDLWVAFCFGWAFGGLLRLWVERVSRGPEMPKRLRKDYFDDGW